MSSSPCPLRRSIVVACCPIALTPKTFEVLSPCVRMITLASGKTPTVAQIDPLGSHQGVAVSITKLDIIHTWEISCVFEISSVALLPEIVVFALVAKRQLLPHQTHFALTRLLTCLCLVLSSRPVPCAVLPYIDSSCACTCHFFSLGTSSTDLNCCLLGRLLVSTIGWWSVEASF